MMTKEQMAAILKEGCEAHKSYRFQVACSRCGGWFWTQPPVYEARLAKALVKGLVTNGAEYDKAYHCDGCRRVHAVGDVGQKVEARPGSNPMAAIERAMKKAHVQAPTVSEENPLG